jgi:two-component system, OmpR family, response regulator
VLRRTQEDTAQEKRASAGVYRFDGWQLDSLRRTLRNASGALADLTAGEFDLLLAFADRPNQVLTRDQLLDLSRGRVSSVFDRSIDVQVSRLRRKIEQNPQQPVLIKTVRSGGYIFAADVTAGGGDEPA